MRANCFSHRRRHTGETDARYLFVPRQARRAACLLHAYYAPEQFHLTASGDSDAIYHWQTKLVAHHFCATCGCGTFSDTPAFEPDGSWDKTTRRISVNARLFDNFEAALAPLEVIDGKNLG